MAAVRRLAADEVPPAAALVADATSGGSARADADVVVLPGVSPRRLAAVVAPVVGESLPSWVDRAAADVQVPAGQMALALGLQVREQRGDVCPLFYGTALTATNRARLTAAIGLSGEEIAALHLSRFDGTVLDFTGLDLADERTVQPLVAREWALFHGSRACPRCLAEAGGVWSLWWRLGAAAVCPRHRVLLVDACPSCGLRVRSGYASHPRGLSRVVAVDRLCCGNYRPSRGGLCGRVRRQRPDRRAAGVAGGLVRVVAHLAAVVRFAADPDHVAAAADGLPLVVSAFHADRDQRRRARAGTPTALRRMPATAALAAALTAVVLPVLSAANLGEAGARLAPLADGRGDRGRRDHRRTRTVVLNHR